MHELLTYPEPQGVVTLLVLAQHGMIGAMGANVDPDLSQRHDPAVPHLRGRWPVRRAISVVKKRRTGSHENAIRELRIDSDGIRVGEPLSAFRGIMTGVPTFEGERSSLLPTAQADDRR